MKNLVDSIRVQIYERLNSPLFGSFVIAWLCWNHRFVAVLFSSLPIDQRFDFIDKHIYTTSWDKWEQGLLYPLATAILFILVYPYPAKFFYGYWLKRQRDLKHLRDKIEEESVLTVEESRKIRIALLNNQVTYEEQIRRQAEEIETLTEKIKSQSKPQVLELPKTSKAKEVDPPKQPEIEEGTLKVIELLAKNNGECQQYVIFNALKEPKVRADFYIDEGKRLGFITTSYMGSADAFKLTEKGRKFAVQAKFA